jgi:AcrR family transcriptional regulator
MNPRVADPAVRTALIEAAALMVATEGVAGLTLRRLATAVGTSTMAIYTHFGGMDQLRREVRREGFSRLGAQLSAVAITNDPVADLGLLGWAYYLSAGANPHLYRAMFLDGPIDDTDSDTGLETFDQVVVAVQRCVDAGRFRGDAYQLATQLWALLHGLVALQLAHMLTPARAVDTLLNGAVNLYLAFGDTPEALDRSKVRIVERITFVLPATPS